MSSINRAAKFWLILSLLLTIFYQSGLAQQVKTAETGADQNIQNVNQNQVLRSKC